MHLFPRKAKKVTGFYQYKHMPFNSKDFCQILYITKEGLCLSLCLWVVQLFGFFLARVHLDFSNFYLWVEDSPVFDCLTLCILNLKKSLKKPPPDNKQKNSNQEKKPPGKKKKKKPFVFTLFYPISSV